MMMRAASFLLVTTATVLAHSGIENDIRFEHHPPKAKIQCLFQFPSVRHHQRHRITDARTMCTRRRYQDDKHNDAVEITGTTSEDRKKYDPITDWNVPSPSRVQQTIEERIQPLRRLTSPIFFSTDREGRRHRGLGHIPSERPLVIVGNHQLGGLDIWLNAPQLMEERDIFVRGLGHPVIFNDAESHLQGGPTFLPDPDEGKQGTFGLYQEFGAVKATPKNFYRLLETKQSILHFPGGAREAYHGQKEAYQLFWPDKVDFVRTAAKFNATIVPLSGIGAADSVYMLADPETMLKLPFGVGDAVSNSLLTVREAARYDEQRDEPYIRPPPLIWPKLLPARHYFLFGRAFHTENVDPKKDRKACQVLYQDIQTELEHGLDVLLRAREKDPFKNSAVRFSYEQVSGKQAPTFPVRELNDVQ